VSQNLEFYCCNSQPNTDIDKVSIDQVPGEWAATYDYKGGFDDMEKVFLANKESLRQWNALSDTQR